jgi:hypothetical protein
MNNLHSQTQVCNSPNRSKHSIQTAIRAELTGSDRCSALGMTVRSSSPVLTLCRQLVEAGHDPATPLKAYRADTLALRVKSIGQGAKLEVDGEGTGFRLRRQPGRATPMRSFSEAAE